MNAAVAALPKVDLHIHQEWVPRMDQVLMQRDGHSPITGQAPMDWRAWAKRLMAEKPPGDARLAHIGNGHLLDKTLDRVPENIVVRLEHLLMEAAADAAVLVEVRLGGETVSFPDILELFRAAERRVQVHYPQLRAEAVATLLLFDEVRLQQTVARFDAMATEGWRGVDMLYQPYVTEAEWTTAYRVGEAAAAAGLGVTVHAGEMSTANIAAALQTPGLSRLGHAVYAAQDPVLLDLVTESGVLIECPLTCNVVLGAVESYEAHPFLQFIEREIPVAICTDDPMQMCTTIGQEYAIAQQLGISMEALQKITLDAIGAAFTTVERRAELVEMVQHFPADGAASVNAAIKIKTDIRLESK